ncbi:MAG: SDR family oxidoreductase [Pseudomonadales bacterium]
MMNTELFDLKDKVALVTGSSRGIGEEIVRLLAKQGAHVIVSSRKLADCQTVVDAIIADGGSAEALECHIGDADAVEPLFGEIERRHGHLDILVNNAATNPYYGPILDTDLASFQKTVDVNIRGYFFMTIAAGKMMKQSGGGCIVNTASVNALTPSPGQSIYSITKAAVVSMTKAFAKELGQYNIRVNAILPGFTETKFAGALFDNEDMYDSIVKTIPLGRHAAPSEMAGAVLYLVSDASSYTTGHALVVDGGLTI